MPMRHRLALIATAAGIMLWSAPGFAQTKCPDGQTLIGTCANAARSEELRRQTIVFTQPKLSYTGAPVPPGIERRYDAIRDRRLGLEYELFGPFGTGGTGSPGGGGTGASGGSTAGPSSPGATGGTTGTGTSTGTATPAPCSARRC